MKTNILIQRRSARRTHNAFTLVELLLVLVILGTLAAIVLPKFTGTTGKARIQQATTQISTFKTALNAFEVSMGTYPKGSSGLTDLIQKPRDSQNWQGPYLDTDAIPLDPWGNPYIYVCPGRHNVGFDLSSAGPDGQPGNEDDITNWTKR